MIEELKEKVFKANLDLVKYGLVIFTWGNVSAIDRKKGLVVIKPSGVSYETMKADDMVVLDLEGEYEKETGNVIVERFQQINPVYVPGVLVENHGPFSWGKDADEAVYNAVVMEQVAKMAYISYGINPQLGMNPHLVTKHFYRKHGPNAYYGQK